MAELRPTDGRIAVSLTYDGGWPCHLAAAEQLESQGWNGTFYLEATRLLENAAGWKDLVAQGHELGNHALYDVIDESGLLIPMPANAYAEEIGDLRALFSELGLEHCSCAYPLPPYRLENGLPFLEAIVLKTVVRLNEELMRSAVQEQYEVARGPKIGLNPLSLPQRAGRRLHFDPLDLRCVPASALSTRALHTLLDQAEEEDAWLVLVFSSERNRWWSDEHHISLLEVLRSRGAWVAPVSEVFASLRSDAFVA